jgi:hypothetical protein
MPAALIRPTTTSTPPEPAAGEPAEDQAEAEGQGRAAAVEAKPKARTRRATAGGETKGRKLSLPDSVFDRLQLTAIQRKKTISAIATEILDRNLPKLRIERDA